MLGLRKTERNITYTYIVEILWIVFTLRRPIKRSTRNNSKKTDEQIEQHVGMERGARVLQTSKDVDKYVLIVEASNNNSKMTV